MGNRCGSLSSPVRPDANPTQQFAVQAVSYIVVHGIAKANMSILVIEKVSFGEYLEAKAMLDPSPGTWPRMGSSCGTWPFRQVADSLRDNPNYSAPGRRSTSNTDHLASLYRFSMHPFPRFAHTLDTTHICDGAPFCLGQAAYLRQENPRE